MFHKLEQKIRRETHGGQKFTGAPVTSASRLLSKHQAAKVVSPSKWFQIFLHVRIVIVYHMICSNSSNKLYSVCRACACNTSSPGLQQLQCANISIINNTSPFLQIFLCNEEKLLSGAMFQTLSIDFHNNNHYYWNHNKLCKVKALKHHCTLTWKGSNPLHNISLITLLPGPHKYRNVLLLISSLTNNFNLVSFPWSVIQHQVF